MSEWNVVGIVIAILIGWGIFYDLRLRLKFLSLRRNHIKLWKRAFSDSDFKSVDKMLVAICESFMIPVDDRYRLSPSDNIHKIYRRNNRWGISGDSLEYEQLLNRLKKDLDVDALRLLKKDGCTAGDLIRMVAQPLRDLRSE
jgi:hypothetical protein